jgi:hypothetical protein
MAKPEKNMLPVVEVRESEGVLRDTLRHPTLDIFQSETVKKLINVSEKHQTIFNLDPEPEKPLRINLKLDQLEDFEE